MTGVWIVFYLAAWVGHGSIAIAVLTRLYGRALPKTPLEIIRQLTTLGILLFPAAFFFVDSPLFTAYLWLCVGVACFVLPAATVVRKLESARGWLGITQQRRVVDLWPTLGKKLLGDGRMRWATRLPGTDVFKVEFTRLTVPVPGLPGPLVGLEMLLLSDFHFHGTPSEAFYEAVLDEIAADPPPELVMLAGDYVDSDEHHTWITRLLPRLAATEGRFAVLGNHDLYHRPDAIRSAFDRIGFTVLARESPGGGVARLTIRGEAVTVVGNEWPWFPWPDLAEPPTGLKIMLSHSPDRFLWASRNGYHLVLAGHVHGGQIRLPVIGPIFVPSVFGRRYDQGVFRRKQSRLIISRGLSGKEPLRFRCPPEVVRIRLTAAVAGG